MASSAPPDRFCFSVEGSPGYLIRRNAQLLLGCASGYLEGSGFSVNQWIALKFLDAGIAKNATELARHLGHNGGATTRLLDQFERRGLVNRNRIEADRRIITISLSELGNAAIEKMGARMRQMWADFLGDFDESEIDLLIGILQQLQRALSAHVVGVENGSSR